MALAERTWERVGELDRARLIESADIYIHIYLTTLIFILFYRPAPKNEDEMMVLIFEYIDRYTYTGNSSKIIWNGLNLVRSCKC